MVGIDDETEIETQWPAEIIEERRKIETPTAINRLAPFIRGDPPITVTPKMIEAGLLHLYGYHPERGIGDEDTVKAIYLAMSRAQDADDGE